MLVPSVLQETQARGNGHADGKAPHGERRSDRSLDVFTERHKSRDERDQCAGGARDRKLREVQRVDHHLSLRILYGDPHDDLYDDILALSG